MPLVSTSCYMERVERSAREQARIELGGSMPRVVVRVDRGSITVEGGDGDSVEVEFETVARAGSERAAEAALLAARYRAVREGDRVMIEAMRTGRRSTHASRSRTNVRVRTPRGATLDLRTRDGSVLVEATDGDISAESDDGLVEFRDVAGTLRMRSGDGRIRGEGLDGEVDASSDDGHVELAGTFRSLRAVTSDGRVRIDASRSVADRSSWTIRSSDGSIRLLVPDGFAADLDISSADDGIDLDVSGFVGEQNDHRVSGTLNGGGPPVLVTASDGGVTIGTR